jgi:hypothetical protein
MIVCSVEKAPKRRFPLPVCHLYIKMMILPRQAQNKHRENSKKSGVFRTEEAGPVEGQLAGRGAADQQLHHIALWLWLLHTYTTVAREFVRQALCSRLRRKQQGKNKCAWSHQDAECYDPARA